MFSNALVFVWLPSHSFFSVCPLLLSHLHFPLKFWDYGYVGVDVGVVTGSLGIVPSISRALLSDSVYETPLWLANAILISSLRSTQFLNHFFIDVYLLWNIPRHVVEYPIVLYYRHLSLLQAVELSFFLLAIALGAILVVHTRLNCSQTKFSTSSSVIVFLCAFHQKSADTVSWKAMQLRRSLSVQCKK